MGVCHSAISKENVVRAVFTLETCAGAVVWPRGAVARRGRRSRARGLGIDEKLMKPSQVLATQTNSSDVERPTEGTLEKKVTEHARRGGGQKVEPLDGSG